jgi:hypothetical protein
MQTADKVMEKMLETFKERGKIYKANYLMIGEVLALMFPEGIVLKTADDHNKWHLFLLTMIKATRLANTNLNHEDSAMDLAVYASMFAGMLMSDDKPKESK